MKLAELFERHDWNNKTINNVDENGFSPKFSNLLRTIIVKSKYTQPQIVEEKDFLQWLEE